MRPGLIEQFTHLKRFSTLEEFNRAVKMHIQLHGDAFTRAERVAFDRLMRFSVKHLGLCNARIGVMVKATHDEKVGISRSTFMRMLKKAQTLGIITISHTIRKQGGYSHSVYVVLPFGTLQEEKLKQRQKLDNAAASSLSPQDFDPKAIKHKANKNHKDLSHTSSIPSDHPNIPSPFVQATRPFHSVAPNFCQRLWYSAMSAYKQLNVRESIETYLKEIIQAFKITMQKYKTNQIEKSLFQYFYGTVAAMISAERRRQYEAKHGFPTWLKEM
ncbi:hypothetical protein [Bacillus sp. FJAT-45037]|uniref:hypothetical protein n=1 Tax=Bacillus sp. FJAT-45037 TaxID=2011007 RepID=UPI000C24FB4F|nr:hypothetical protein [Bacillus sp. FJAT-45037]